MTLVPDLSGNTRGVDPEFAPQRDGTPAYPYSVTFGGYAQNGSPVTGTPILVAGSDGTNARTLLTSATGALIITSQAANPVATHGNIAQDGVDSGNPIKIGGVAIDANRTAVSAALDRVDATYTLNGAALVRPYAAGGSSWQYAAATGGIVNTTTAVTVKAAGAAGVRNYITSIQIDLDVLGAATEVAIRDGAGGTVLWRMKIPMSVGGMREVVFPVPIKGTAATLLEVVTLTASVTGGVLVNVQGFEGA